MPSVPSRRVERLRLLTLSLSTPSGCRESISAGSFTLLEPFSNQHFSAPLCLFTPTSSPYSGLEIPAALTGFPRGKVQRKTLFWSNKLIFLRQVTNVVGGHRFLALPRLCHYPGIRGGKGHQHPPRRSPGDEPPLHHLCRHHVSP